MNPWISLLTGILLAQDPAVTSETLAVPDSWPRILRDAIVEKGWHVRYGDRGNAWYFPARKVTALAEKEQIHNGLLPDSLETGTLVGCLIMDHQWSDFRGQGIPAGAYSLHYGLQPVTDDHAETAPSRHFAVFVPIHAEGFRAKPNEETLRKTSTAINGKHPVVAPLLPGTPGKEPRLSPLEGGIWTLGFSIEAQTPAGKAPLLLRLVISGKSPAAK